MEDAEESDSASLSTGLSDEQDSEYDLDDRDSLQSRASRNENNDMESHLNHVMTGENSGDQKELSSSMGDSTMETHDKTECDCGKDGHYEKVVCDEIIKASLPRVWNCVYGESKEFILSFLRDNQKLQGMMMMLTDRLC